MLTILLLGVECDDEYFSIQEGKVITFKGEKSVQAERLFPRRQVHRCLRAGINSQLVRRSSSKVNLEKNYE